MATEREIIAKVLELKAALDALGEARVEDTRATNRVTQAQVDQIQAATFLANAVGQVNTIRSQLKAML
jgi:hypothetical protein